MSTSSVLFRYSKCRDGQSLQPHTDVGCIQPRLYQPVPLHFASAQRYSEELELSHARNPIRDDEQRKPPVEMHVVCTLLCCLAVTMRMDSARERFER